MNKLVSIKLSTLIHLVPRQLSPHAELAAQLPDRLHCPLGLLLAPRVIGQPQSELLVEGRMLSPRPLARSLDQTLISTQRDVLHQPNSSTDPIYTIIVHTTFVRTASSERWR